MILALQVSHFTAAVTFSIFTSIVFGITQRNTPQEMLRFTGYCFMMFVFVGLFLGGWFMWILHH
jgi:hypothetical protein